MSCSDTNRAPGICAASYSALSPTCSRTRSGSARCAFNQPASTTRFCRGLPNAPAAIRQIKSIFFIEVSFDDEDASGATPCRQVCSQEDWEGGEMGAGRQSNCQLAHDVAAEANTRAHLRKSCARSCITRKQALSIEV